MLCWTKAARRSAAFFILGYLLSGCATRPWLSPDERADYITREGGLKRSKEMVGDFLLTRYVSANPANNPVLTVYIEGDGAPWLSVKTPPRDPTPWRPVALELANQDLRYPVAYIARPCQYLTAAELASCDYRYWTQARFSVAAVSAINAAISQSKVASGAERLRLIGYSGGGVIASLVAAQRDDVDSLITIASPLDIDAWAAIQKISPLRDSLNPMDFLPALSRIRQAHLIGENDVVVPPGYIKAVQNSFPSARFIVVPGYKHECCWIENWREWLPDDLR
jgi:pimeloyl-ACP methyl ester carboxylesterase